MVFLEMSMARSKKTFVTCSPTLFKSTEVAEVNGRVSPVSVRESLMTIAFLVRQDTAAPVVCSNRQTNELLAEFCLEVFPGFNYSIYISFTCKMEDMKDKSQ